MARREDQLDQLRARCRAEAEVRVAQRAVERGEAVRGDLRARVQQLGRVRAPGEQAMEVADLRVERGGEALGERAARGQRALHARQRFRAELRGERGEQVFLGAEVEV